MSTARGRQVRGPRRNRPSEYDFPPNGGSGNGNATVASRKIGQRAGPSAELGARACMAISNWISGRVFQYVHGNNLVYNTRSEAPRLDRQALQSTADDHVLVITSAGCNALDYALAGPAHVYAVDMNPRQNALLELKLAGIRQLEFDDFFQLFGIGFHPLAGDMYQRKLRGELSVWSQAYWDRFIKFFDNPHRTFYYRGTSGAFARMIRTYIDRVAKVRPEVDRILNANRSPATGDLLQYPRSILEASARFAAQTRYHPVVGVPRLSGSKSNGISGRHSEFYPGFGRVGVCRLYQGQLFLASLYHRQLYRGLLPG